MEEYLDMLFDWDENKAQENEEKHGVTFEEAMTAFGDDHAQIYDDEEHSASENRFILLGFSEKKRILMICHCYRESDTVTRIISARKATPHERKRYEFGG
jgi:uncharacterized DUF497 family protein